MEEYGIMEYLDLAVTRCGRWTGNREFIWSGLKQYIINKNKLSYIWASATYTAIGASAMGQRKLDLAPRMHIIADLNKEKLNLHLSHPITIP